MNKRILIAGMCDTNVRESLMKCFDVCESTDVEDTSITLLDQYRFIKVVLIGMELFRKDNYHIVDEIHNTVLLKHIPVICIASNDEDISKQTSDYHDAIVHGALGFYASPLNLQIITQHINNIMNIKDESVDSIIMSTTIGAACLIESRNDTISVLKSSVDFTCEIFGNRDEEVDIEHFFEDYLDSKQRHVFQDTIETSLKSNNTKVECNLEIKGKNSSQSVIFLRVVMRMVERIKERVLIYCILENETDKYNSINVENDLMNQMQVIIKSLNCGISIGYDNFGSLKYEYANELFYSIFGYTKEEFDEEIGDMQELVLPEYYFEVKTGLNNARTQRRPVVLVFQARKKDGTVIWVKIRCSVYFMKAKGKSAFITTYEDITNMKAMEDRLLSINEKLANSEVYIQLNLTDRVVEEYHSNYEPENNELSAKYRNYQEQLLAYVYERDKESTWNMLSYDNLLKNYYAGNTKLSIEYRRHIPGGKVKWFAATAIMLRGRENDTISAIIYVHEIDDRMKVRVAKNKIMDSEVDDITIINIASGLCRNVKIYDSVIENSEKMNPYTDNLDLFVDTEVAPEDRDRCRKFFSLGNLIQKVKGKETVSMSFWIVTKSGANVRKNATVTFLDSTKEDLLLVGRDITELFEKEKEQQMALENAAKVAELANQAKTDFLSRMSHDMRTPLNTILGLTGLAEEEQQMEEIKKYIKNIDLSGHYLLSLINDTLDLSKIESGKMELHRESYPLPEFILGIDTMFQPLMEAKNIEFEMNLKKQINNIAVDKVRFNQIFYNLLSNAVKYTPEGGKVEFFSEAIEPKGELCGMRFHVRDNGIGMSEEYLKVLFEPFSQEYSAVQKEQKGTGLGLAIVKQIVDLAQGNIEVISAPGKGTEFIVDIYAHRMDELSQLPVKEKYDAEKLRGLHVLLADDSEINSFIVQKMLQMRGCIVDIAKNGKEAVNMFAQSELHYYDIILTDIRMPVMNGFEEAVAIRALEREDARTIPIIAATADAYDDIRVKILEAGMNERLVKPIEADRLCMTIICLLDHQ